MSTFYLFDGHTPVLDDSPLVDVIKVPDTSTPVDIGTSFPVRVSDDIRIPREPTSPTDLETMKHTAIQERYGFGNIVYDDLLSAPTLHPSPSFASNYQTGQRKTFGLWKDTGLAYFNVVALGLTPSICRIDVETWYYIHDTDPVTGSPRRQILDRTGEVEVDVTLNFQGVADGTGIVSPSIGTTIPIPVVDQGSNFVLGVSSNQQAPNTTRIIIIGGWSLLYQ